jgi:hypothetical protein
MSKQTAVEWLLSQFEEYGYDGIVLENVVQQAKQMEKEQIEDAHEIGYINGGNHKNVNGEQYYNETFGGTE